MTQVYRKYFSAGGNSIKWGLLLSLQIVTQSLYTISDVFFAYMVNQTEQTLLLFNLLVFAGLSIGIPILAFFRTFLHHVLCLKSSETIHNDMFMKILKAPSRFFDVNPGGRILNRFSKDLGLVDELLPESMYEVTCIFLLCFGSIVIAMYFKPILIPPSIIILVIFYYMRLYYLASSRPMKLMDGITKSPIFTQLSSTLDGLNTIRSCEAEEFLIGEFDQKQDVHSSTCYSFQNCAGWLAIGLDMVGNTFVTLCILAFLMMDGNQGKNFFSHSPCP